LVFKNTDDFCNGFTLFDLPINILEKWMSFNLSVSVLSIAYPFLNLLDEYLLDEINQLQNDLLILYDLRVTFISEEGSISTSLLSIFFQTMPSLVSKKGDFLKII
jgi:hypothetical protein